MALSPTQQAAADLEAAIMHFQRTIADAGGLFDDGERQLLLNRIETSKRTLDRIAGQIRPITGQART